MVTNFIFLGSKITVDGDCSMKLKHTCSLEGKLWQILTAPWKAEISFCWQRSLQLKLWFYQYLCTDVRAGPQRRLSTEELKLSNCIVGEDSWESLRQQGDQTRQSYIQKINPEYLLEGLMLKLQYFGHLLWSANSLEKTPMLGKTEGRRRRGRQRMRCLDNITPSKLQETVKDTGSLACCSLCGHRVGHDLGTAATYVLILS